MRSNHLIKRPKQWPNTVKTMQYITIHCLTSHAKEEMCAIVEKKNEEEKGATHLLAYANLNGCPMR